jgi:hypothetical protein
MHGKFIENTTKAMISARIASNASPLKTEIMHPLTANSLAKTAKIIALFCKILSNPATLSSTAPPFNLSQRKNIRRKTNAPTARKIIAVQSVVCVCLEIEFVAFVFIAQNSFEL